MAIQGEQLKCQFAELEEKTWKQPQILCGLAGVPCKFVDWDNGMNMQTEECRECPKYDDRDYKDEVGGIHGGGIGHAPDGTWCGECSSSSCKDCSVWLKKKV